MSETQTEGQPGVNDLAEGIDSNVASPGVNTNNANDTVNPYPAGTPEHDAFEAMVGVTTGGSGYGGEGPER